MPQKSLLVMLLTLIMGVSASADTQNFSTCLIDSLNGKERKLLARWIYFGMAEHPEIAPYSNISEDDITESDQFVGSIFSRLLLEDCAQEFKTAQRANPNAIEIAFGAVGEVAMQELMNNRTVIEGLTGYTEYADMQGIQNLLAD